MKQESYRDSIISHTVIQAGAKSRPAGRIRFRGNVDRFPEVDSRFRGNDGDSSGNDGASRGDDGASRGDDGAPRGNDGFRKKAAPLVSRLAAIIAAVFISGGCGGEGSQLFNFDDFDVAQCVPMAGQTGVDPDTAVEVFFNTDASAPDVERGFSLSGASGKVEGSFSWIGRSAFRFVPRYQLKMAERYSVEIPASVRSRDGRKLSAAFLSDFYVGDHAANPGVASSVPAHVNGGAVTDPSTLSEITFTFTRAMGREKTQAAFSISPYVSGIFQWSPDGTILTYRFTSARLEYGKTYTVTVGSAAEDPAGNPMARDFTLILIAGDDSEPPSVLGINETGGIADPFWYTPESGIENSIARTMSTVYTCFSEPMDKASVESAFSITPSADGYVTWLSDRVMRYHIENPLQTEQAYRIAVDTGAKDIHSLRLPEPYSVIVRTTAIESTHITVGKVWGSGDRDALPDDAANLLFSGNAIPWPVTIDHYVDTGDGNGFRYCFMVQFIREVGGAEVSMNKTSLLENYLVEDYDPYTAPRVIDIDWVSAGVGRICIAGLLHGEPIPVLYRFSLCGGNGGIRDSPGNTMENKFSFEFKEKLP